MGAAWIARGLEALERAVAGRRGPFCYGDAPTLADLYLVPQLYGARRFGVDLARLPDPRRIEAACRELEAVPAPPQPDRQPDAPPPDERSRSWPSSSRSASRVWRRCTTTCTTSSGAAASTRERLDFAELAQLVPELEREGRQRSAVFEAGRRARRLLAADRRGRARVALPAQAPRRRRHARLRGGGRRAGASGCSRSAAARRSPTSSASRDDGRHATALHHHDALRRHDLPLRQRHGYRALYPGHGRPRRAAGRPEPLRLRRRRPRHLELPDDEAGAPLDGARARASRSSGRSSSTRRTSASEQRRKQRQGSGLRSDRDAGPDERA